METLNTCTKFQELLRICSFAVLTQPQRPMKLQYESSRASQGENIDVTQAAQGGTFEECHQSPQLRLPRLPHLHKLYLSALQGAVPAPSQLPLPALHGARSPLHMGSVLLQGCPRFCPAHQFGLCSRLGIESNLLCLQLVLRL